LTSAYIYVYGVRASMLQLQDALAKDEKIIAEDNKTIQEVSGCAGLPADVPCWRSMVCRGSGGGRRGEEVMMRHSVSRWGEQESAEIEDLKKKLKQTQVPGPAAVYNVERREVQK
jgi:hypothetical protein